jgi:hypothetical protein
MGRKGWREALGREEVERRTNKNSPDLKFLLFFYKFLKISSTF